MGIEPLSFRTWAVHSTPGPERKLNLNLVWADEFSFLALKNYAEFFLKVSPNFNMIFVSKSEALTGGLSLLGI